MFCPACGLKEDRPVQFCRACGADLRAVREALEQPEAAEPSVAAAREEVARALAARIKEGEWWQAGALAPEVEKLFESPRARRARLRRQDEEQRLVRLRGGTITAAVGLGLVILFQLLRIMDDRALLLLGPSLLVFIIGLGVIVNGLFFTVPKRPRHPDAAPDELRPGLPDNSTSELGAPPRGALGSADSFIPASVTEQTTQNLRGEPLKTPRRG
ncbi:MAG: hypothetical protein JOZ02_03975 [Acidobacteria bacterium]|nr:hypothetical protein [Acidobacteriota bacterium]